MSISAVASAENISVDTTNLESPVIVINLGQNDIQSALQTLDYNEGNSTRATDGRNISYEFKDMTYATFSASPLPLNTYGKVTLKLVQTSDTSTKNLVNFELLVI